MLTACALTQLSNIGCCHNYGRSDGATKLGGEEAWYTSTLAYLPYHEGEVLEPEPRKKAPKCIEGISLKSTLQWDDW